MTCECKEGPIYVHIGSKSLKELADKVRAVEGINQFAVPNITPSMDASKDKYQGIPYRQWNVAGETRYDTIAVCQRDIL